MIYFKYIYIYIEPCINLQFAFFNVFIKMIVCMLAVNIFNHSESEVKTIALHWVCVRLLVLPKFHSCFYNSLTMKRWGMLSSFETRVLKKCYVILNPDLLAESRRRRNSIGNIMFGYVFGTTYMTLRYTIIFRESLMSCHCRKICLIFLGFMDINGKNVFFKNKGFVFSNL